MKGKVHMRKKGIIRKAYQGTQHTFFLSVLASLLFLRMTMSWARQTINEWLVSIFLYWLFPFSRYTESKGSS